MLIIRVTSVSDNYQWQNLFSISSQFLNFDSLKFERYFSNSEKIQKFQKQPFRDILERFLLSLAKALNSLKLWQGILLSGISILSTVPITFHHYIITWLDLQAESENLVEELKSIKTHKQPPGVFCKKRCSENFANFAALLKRDSGLSAFLCNLQNFQELLFWRTSANGCL